MISSIIFIESNDVICELNQRQIISVNVFNLQHFFKFYYSVN